MPVGPVDNSMPHYIVLLDFDLYALYPPVFLFLLFTWTYTIALPLRPLAVPPWSPSISAPASVPFSLSYLTSNM